MKVIRDGTIRLKRILCILVGVLLLLSLTPLFGIAQYDIPVGDDVLAFQAGVAQVWDETHSFGAVLKTSYEKTVEYYNSWQGTYFSSMLMHVLTGIMPVSLYWITPIVILLILIASTLYLSYVLAVRYLRLDWLSWLLIALTALLFQIQLMPNIKEGVYWLNTASLYTLSYCWLLLMFGFLLNANSSGSVFLRILLTILAALCAVAVGGGAFPLMIPAILISAWILFRTIANRDRYAALQSGFVLLVLTLCTVVSVGAPGNQARVVFEHGYYGSHGMGLIEAVFRSVQTGILFAAQSMDMAMLFFCGVCMVLFYEASKRSSIRFYHPILVLIITFGLFCMQFTPTFYTLASSGPDRLKNLIYFSLYWLAAVNMFNLEGWLIQKRKVDSYIGQIKEALARNGGAFAQYARKALIVLSILLIFLAFAQRESGFYANPSIRAAVEIKTGTAALHAEESRGNMKEGAVQGYQYGSSILP